MKKMRRTTLTWKSGEADKRDLSTKFSSDILRIANKSRTTEESQATAGGLNLLIKQNGVPSAVNFHHEFKKIKWWLTRH